MALECRTEMDECLQRESRKYLELVKRDESSEGEQVNGLHPDNDVPEKGSRDTNDPNLEAGGSNAANDLFSGSLTPESED